MTIVDGSYDDAVAAARQHADRDDIALLVQDTAFDGYEEVPGWIVEGYSTLFVELDDQLAAQGHAPADLLVVPAGVGSLLQAALNHVRSEPATSTYVVAVEPDTAACVTASIQSGTPISIETGETIMAGLNCGTVSTLAWPVIRAGLDATVNDTDREAHDAMTSLHEAGIPAGPCGASSLAALRSIARDAVTPERVWSPDATAVIIVTEGSDANPRRLT